MSKKMGKRNYYDYFFLHRYDFFFQTRPFLCPMFGNPYTIWIGIPHESDYHDRFDKRYRVYEYIHTPYNIAIDDCPEIRDLHSRSRSSKRLTGDIQGTPYSEG